MRTVAAVAIVIAAGGCAAAAPPVLRPPARSAPLIGIPLVRELEITVVDSTGAPVSGAEGILQSEPAPRHVKSQAAGIVKYVGFVGDPRFFIVCAPGFVCSGWIDMEALGFGSMRQTVTLERER